jgi:hypothetical protein
LYIGAYVLWIVNYLLYSTARAREADEFYFFLIYVQSIAAGYGAYWCLKRVYRWTGIAARRKSQAIVLAASLVAVAPLGFPYWWDPLKMDNHFQRALEPLPRAVEQMADWIRQETEGGDVFISSGGVMQWIPALSGRQTRRPTGPIVETLHLLSTGEPRLETKEAFARVGATYIAWNGALMEETGLNHDFFDITPRFESVFSNEVVRIYMLK